MSTNQPYYPASDPDQPPTYPTDGGMEDYGQMPPNPMEKNSFNGWALALSVIGLCCLPTAIAGIIMGVQGRKAAAEGRATNGGVATAAIVIGCVSLVLTVIATVLQFQVLSDMQMSGGL